MKKSLIILTVSVLIYTNVNGTDTITAPYGVQLIKTLTITENEGETTRNITYLDEENGVQITFKKIEAKKRKRNQLIITVQEIATGNTIEKAIINRKGKLDGKWHFFKHSENADIHIYRQQDGYWRPSRYVHLTCHFSDTQNSYSFAYDLVNLLRGRTNSTIQIYN